jgi:hypothetical protein
MYVFGKKYWLYSVFISCQWIETSSMYSWNGSSVFVIDPCLDIFLCKMVTLFSPLESILREKHSSVTLVFDVGVLQVLLVMLQSCIK